MVNPPGEAQAVFGEATIRHGGVERKVALFVMTLPYSGAIFIQAFPRECTETFLEGHRRAFEFFGGVPYRISYDNSAIAVPECWGLLRRRLEAHDPRHGTRSYIQVLRLLEKFPMPQLTAAVEYALDVDVIDAASIRTIVEHRSDRPVQLFPLDGRPHLAHVQVETTDVSSYQTLLSDPASHTEVFP